MGFLSDTLKFEGFHGKRIGEALMKDPSRLLTGVDPASTWMWNKVLGTHNKPIVDQMGGATGADYKAASNAGINTTAGHDMQDLAHVVAAAYATAGLAGAGGAGAGGAGEAGGGVGAAGDGTGAVTTGSGFGGVGTDAGATGFGGWGTASGADPAGLAAADSAAVDAEGAAPGLTGSYGPASGSSSGGINYQQMLGKALGQMGQQKQQQGQGGGAQHPVNVQPGNVPWNFMGGM